MCFQLDDLGSEVQLVGQMSLREYRKHAGIVTIFPLKFFDQIFVLFSDSVLVKLTMDLEFLGVQRLLHEGDNRLVRAAKLSPIEESLAVVFDNGRVANFSKSFHKEGEEWLEGAAVEVVTASVAWRGDSKCFSINYSTGSGTKAVTFSFSLEKIQSKSLYRPDYELVTNVFEKPDPTLRELNVWASNGSAVYGVATAPTSPHADDHLLCWEANGLTYKTFTIPEELKTPKAISQIVFNPTSEVMVVVSQSPHPALYLFLRSNADWYPKTKTDLPFANPCVLSFDRELIVSTDGALLVLDYALSNDLFDYTIDG
jgi:hypothetical protein